MNERLVNGERSKRTTRRRKLPSQAMLRSTIQRRSKRGERRGLQTRPPAAVVTIFCKHPKDRRGNCRNQRATLPCALVV